MRVSYSTNICQGPQSVGIFRKCVMHVRVYVTLEHNLCHVQLYKELSEMPVILLLPGQSTNCPVEYNG